MKLEHCRRVTLRGAPHNQTLAAHSPWTEGEVWRVQGETCLARGDWAGAHAAFAKAMENGWEVQFEFALVLLARGDPGGAADTITRALEENAFSCRSRRGRALCSLTMASARAGRLEAARSALTQVSRLPELVDTPALQNLLVVARAELSAAEGRRRDAIGLLREAVRNWNSLDAPLAAGECRCRLAEWLAAEGEFDFALLELSAAEALFESAGADPLIRKVRAARKGLRSRG